MDKEIQEKRAEVIHILIDEGISWSKSIIIADQIIKLLKS